MFCFDSYVIGKTTLALRFLQHEKEIFSSPFDFYYWCLPNGSTPPSEISQRGDFNIHYGVPDGVDIPHNSLVFLDDLQHEQGLATQLLHTVHSHHRNLTIITLNHSIFPKNRFQRDQTQSTKYMIICKNPRDTSSFFRLALQLEPSRARSLYEAYQDACSQPFGYLLCDLTQRAHSALRYRTKVLPSDGQSCIYATEQDISRLLQSDECNYVRFSDAAHSSLTSNSQSQQGSEEGSLVDTNETGGKRPL